jgi:hypothetical protein
MIEFEQRNVKLVQRERVATATAEAAVKAMEALTKELTEFRKAIIPLLPKRKQEPSKERPAVDPFGRPSRPQTKRPESR